MVKETDYAEMIYGEDCFPTTMICIVNICTNLVDTKNNF